MSRDEPTERILLKAEEWPFVQLPSELLLCREIQDAAKLTYLSLRFWSRSHPSTFASHDNVRDVTGVGRSTFYRHLRSLEDAGWIRREQRDDGLAEIHVLNAKISPISETRPVPQEGPPPSRLRDSWGPAGGTHTEKHSTEKQSTESTPPRGGLFGHEEDRPKPSRQPKYSAGFEAFWAEARKAWARLGDPTGTKAEAAQAFKACPYAASELLGFLRDHLPRVEARRKATGQHTQIKHVCRWIKYSQWEEDLPAQAPAEQDMALRRAAEAQDRARRSRALWDTLDEQARA